MVFVNEAGRCTRYLKLLHPDMGRHSFVLEQGRQGGYVGKYYDDQGLSIQALEVVKQVNHALDDDVFRVRSVSSKGTTY